MKTLREAAGFSQEALARQLNVSSRSVQTWERGDSVPGLDKAVGLAKVLKVTLEAVAESVGIDTMGTPNDHLSVGQYEPKPLDLLKSSDKEHRILAHEDLEIPQVRKIAMMAKKLRVPLKALLEAFEIDTSGIPDDRPQEDPDPSQSPVRKDD